MAASKDFEIHKGKTFSTTLRWGTEPTVYRPITAITRSAPVRITVEDHAVPDGWQVAVTSVKGMTQINALNAPPKTKDYLSATVIDADTIEINSVNSADFKAYVSGGYVQYKTPVDLTGLTGRIAIKTKKGGVLLAASYPYEVDGETVQPILTVVLDPAEFTIAVEITADDTADVTWKKGVYELEIIDDDVVTCLIEGAFSVKEEVPT